MDERHTRLRLLQLPTAWGLRNASAFNLKAEALLAMSGLDYECEQAFPNKGPKKKLPALVDGDRVIGDSSLIQKHLEQHYGIDFDGELSPRERADAEAYRRMAEEHLYFVVLYVRWILFPQVTRDALFGTIPQPVRTLLFAKLRRDVRRTLWGQGIGRHTEDEIVDFGIGDIDALAHRIGDGPFFFGDRLTSIDAALFPQIQNVTEPPFETRLRAHARTHRNLLEYCARCNAEIFGE